MVPNARSLTRFALTLVPSPFHLYTLLYPRPSTSTLYSKELACARPFAATEPVDSVEPAQQQRQSDAPQASGAAVAIQDGTLGEA